MTTYSSLTDGQDALVAAAIQALTGSGYAFDPLTMSFSSYLATALTGLGGSDASNLTMSTPEMLAGLINALGVGPVSHLTTGVDDLLAMLGNVSGPVLNLSAATIADSASVGDVIGTLSVSNGTGSYTYSLTSNPGTLFSITTDSLEVAASLTAGSDPITIKADNGAGSVVSRAFMITVTSSGGGTNFTATYLSQGVY